VVNELRADRQYVQERSTLWQTASRITVTRATLSAVRRHLDELNQQIGMNAQSITRDTENLGSVRTEVAHEEANVAVQGSDIAALHACLGGVEQSLNALAVGDKATAIRELRGVSGSCQTALGPDG
jgi:hypothetical protein